MRLIGRALKGFMFGDRLGAVDEERFLAAWVRVASQALDQER